MNWNIGPRVKANIAGLPKGYETMPFGRQIEYNSIIKDFKDTAKTGYLDTKRKSVSAALSEFKKLYGVKEYYFIDTTAPGYKDDSIKIWYKTAMQTNPAKPPITRQWKPMLVRTNAQGQVQVTPQAVVKVKAKAVQAKNSKNGRRNPGDSGALNPLDSILSAAGYSSRAGTTTRDASGEIWRTEYRNGPGKSITVLSDRRGSGKPSYAWISNGPVLPAHSGVRTKQTLATLKRTLKAHLKKMGRV